MQDYRWYLRSLKFFFLLAFMFAAFSVPAAGQNSDTPKSNKAAGAPTNAGPGPSAGDRVQTAVAEPREPRLVLDSYLLRSLALEGYAPSLQECARCGTADTPLVGFAVAAGGAPKSAVTA